MVGQTLTKIRKQIETRAVDDGQYVVLCGRTGERIVPLDGHRFPDRETAAEAARFAEQYRAALRRYDPQVPCYDPIVCEVPALEQSPSPHEKESTKWAFPPAPALPGRKSGRIEFCHQVAGAVFETLSNMGYEKVERAVMDAYFEAAETIPSRDTLCLRLLEQMAIELDARLSNTQQASVLVQASSQLPAPSAQDSALTAAFDRLEAIGLLDSYSTSPWIVDPVGGERQCHVSVTDYALTPVDTIIPTLPISIDLLRRQPDTTLDVSAVARINAETWQFTLTADSDAEPAGLTTVPFTENP